MENQIITDLKAGRVVTVPTETVYGFAVSLSSKTGIKSLMEYKERGKESGKVFTLVPESVAAIKKYAIITKCAKELIKQYVPGEITIILPKNPKFRHFYYDYFDTIGIRIPDYSMFQNLLKAVGPIILTSANKKGGTPKSDTGHLPSTIVDCTGETPRVIRQGNLVI
jgi:tRNA threonylcarbamoyl adenosine modification protein (Sua5/YciO/YrdC/YwlC family)